MSKINPHTASLVTVSLVAEQFQVVTPSQVWTVSVMPYCSVLYYIGRRRYGDAPTRVVKYNKNELISFLSSITVVDGSKIRSFGLHDGFVPIIEISQCAVQLLKQYLFFSALLFMIDHIFIM